MDSEQIVTVLNRLLVILYRSLPMFLTQAPPWTHKGDEPASATLANIVADQERDCRRLAEMIASLYGPIEQGEFLMEFTNYHFLSFDFLLQKLAEHQKRDIALIERCAAQLAGDAAAKELAQEILGSELAHLEQLEELVRLPA